MTLTLIWQLFHLLLFNSDLVPSKAREEIRDMIARSVISSTRAKYVSVELTWKRFRFDKYGIVDDMFNCNGTYLSMVFLVLEWMRWMEKDMEFSMNVIGKMMTGMVFVLSCYVVHADVMLHPSIVRARKAIAPLQARRSGSDNKMGVTLDMLQHLRLQLWMSNDLDAQMTYIAIATGYNFTMRPGHITYMGSGATDHRYQMGDITLESEDGRELLSYTEWMNTFVNGSSAFSIGIIILRIDSSKSHGKRNGGDGSLNFICTGNEFESQYFEDFVQWLTICGLIEKPKWKVNSEGSLPVLQRPLFSRIHPETKLFKKSIVKDISTALKSCAGQLDLNPQSFSGKSVRIGGCTTAVASGASSDEILRATGHAGIQTSRIYTRSTRHKATSLGFGNTVVVQDVKRMSLKRHKE